MDPAQGGSGDATGESAHVHGAASKSGFNFQDFFQSVSKRLTAFVAFFSIADLLLLAVYRRRYVDEQGASRRAGRCCADLAQLVGYAGQACVPSEGTNTARRLVSCA